MISEDLDQLDQDVAGENPHRIGSEAGGGGGEMAA